MHWITLVLVLSSSHYSTTLMEPKLNYEPLTDEVSVELRRQCQGAMPAGEGRLDGTVITDAYHQRANDILDLEVREDDIWVISFPKCGTTWTQEMVWLLINNLNFDQAKSTYLYERFPFLEYKLLWGKNSQEIPDLIEHIKNLKSPRCIKTHLPVNLLPKQIWTKKPKIIYVARNPKDAAISYFHHFTLWNNYIGSQELFLKAFVEDKVIFSPFWKHVLDYWRIRDEPNVLFNTFEDMKKDLRPVLKRTADFLGVNYNTKEEAELLNHLSFASMKNNKSVNFEEDIRQIEQKEGKTGLSFMRQGETGAWKKVLTPEQNKEFEEWTARNLKGTDYPTELNVKR